MSSTFVEAILGLGFALGAGLLVGVERERTGGIIFAGARTFPLFSLAGALAALLGVWVLVAAATILGLLIAVAYFRDSSEESLGMSTEVAAVVVFCLGALCTTNRIDLPFHERLLLVAAGATVTLALLSFKEPLHWLVARISKEEIYATSKLLLLSVILLPLLPDEDVGPWQTLNPYSIGLLVVLISALGFVGYIAIRVLGIRRGVGLTGILGGLASSTAVTLTFAGRSRQNLSLSPACAVAIVLASAVMFPRVLVMIYAVSPNLTLAVLWPCLFTAAVALILGTILYLKAPRDPDHKQRTAELQLQNPFSMASAFQFALLFVVVLLISGGAAHYFQETGVYFSATFAGMADADSVALSMAKMYQAGTIEKQVAARALGISLIMNTLVKIGISFVLGGRRLGLLVGRALITAIIAGAGLYYILYV